MVKEPQTGDVYRHKENGNEYLFMLISNRQSEKWEDRAVYADIETGAIYDRLLSEFIEKYEAAGWQLITDWRFTKGWDLKEDCRK